MIIIIVMYFAKHTSNTGRGQRIIEKPNYMVGDIGELGKDGIHTTATEMRLDSATPQALSA